MSTRHYFWKEAGFFESKPNDSIYHKLNLFNTWFSVQFIRSLPTIWKKLNLIVFLKIYNKILLFKDWQRSICKWFYHAINLRINRLSIEFYLVLEFFLSSQKSGGTCISSKDLRMMWYNLTLTFQLNCMRSTRTIQCCDPSEWFWVYKNHRWMDWNARCFTCVFGMKRGMKVTLAVSCAEQSCVL